MAPSRHDWKIVDWDVKPQHNQPTTKVDMDAKFVENRKFIQGVGRINVVPSL